MPSPAQPNDLNPATIRLHQGFLKDLPARCRKRKSRPHAQDGSLALNSWPTLGKVNPATHRNPIGNLWQSVDKDKTKDYCDVCVGYFLDRQDICETRKHPKHDFMLAEFHPGAVLANPGNGWFCDICKQDTPKPTYTGKPKPRPNLSQRSPKLTRHQSAKAWPQHSSILQASTATATDPALTRNSKCVALIVKQCGTQYASATRNEV